MLNLGVLASGEGTTLQAVLDACQGGRLEARVCVVISNNSGAGALRRAEAAGVPRRHLSSKTEASEGALDEAITVALRNADVDVVLLAGYMKKLGAQTLRAFAGRILNTHPALLPKFGGHGMYGERVHRAVLAAGERESGATVHLVTDEYDTGPVVRQCRVSVAPDDTFETLARRVQAAERELVVEVLAELAAGRPLPHVALTPR
jgi:phosphoribosylglycinamide formyltransferase 1